jgi:outer membrane receptor for ferrienterochelin and colicins
LNGSRRKVALALSAVVLAAPAAARADDLQGLLEEQVVSTASKAPETASEAPASSTVLTAEDMYRHGIRSLDEAINFLSMGVVIENKTHDNEIGARGVHFAGDYQVHALLLVNGHAMNEPWDGTTYFERGTGVPFELIDHIEVILGPGSVLYGSNAMLAVINVVTKRAKDWQGVHLVAESEIPTSIRAAAGVGHTFKLFGKQAEVTAEFEYFAQNGPSFTYGPQAVGTRREEFLGPIVHHQTWGGVGARDNYATLPTGYVRFIIGDFEVNLRGEYWKRAMTSVNAYIFDDPTNYEVERWLSGDIKHHAVLSSSIDLTSRFYADTYDYVQNYPQSSACIPGMPLGCYYHLVGVSRWMGLEEQLSIDWLKDGRVYTLIGVDGRLRGIGSKLDYIEYLTNRNPGSYNPYDISEKALGAYAQQILRPVKQVSLNAGVRLDADDTFGAHVSPRVALGLHPWDGGTFKAIYSEAFRSPTAYERYYADVTGTVPAPDLQPETVQSFELAFDQRAKSQHVLFGVFRTLYNDLVLSQSLSQNEIQAAKAQGLLEANVKNADQYRNVASAEAWGFNTAFDGTALSSRLRYGATFTAGIARYHQSESAPGQELQAAPQVSGNARISYELGGYLPTPALVGRFVGSRLATEGPPLTYAPPLAEIRVALSGKLPWPKGLGYRASLNYASASTLPYTVGPTYLHPFTPVSTVKANELWPVDQLRTAVGLFYDLGL